MNIQPINNNISMQKKSGNGFNSIKNKIAQKTIDAIPSHTAKDSAKKIEIWEQVNDTVSKPLENRGIMGLTALFTQPVIDKNNHRVNKDTREVAANRTIAKIIAGTGVGMFVVRGPVYTAIQSMTNLKGNSKYSKALMPKKYLNEISENPKFLKNYQSALAMAVALGAMCITNFALDAPLTIWLTNLLNRKTGAGVKGEEFNRNYKLGVSKGVGVNREVNKGAGVNEGGVTSNDSTCLKKGVGVIEGRTTSNDSINYKKGVNNEK